MKYDRGGNNDNQKFPLSQNLRMWKNLNHTVFADGIHFKVKILSLLNCIETDTKGDKSAKDICYFSKENKNLSNSDDFTNKGWINSMCLHF